MGSVTFSLHVSFFAAAAACQIQILKKPIQADNISVVLLSSQPPTLPHVFILLIRANFEQLVTTTQIIGEKSGVPIFTWQSASPECVLDGNPTPAAAAALLP